MRTRWQILLLALLLSSCGDDSPTGSTDGPTVTVMTWNVYIGGDVRTSFNTENPLQLPADVAAFWAAVNASDFPSRAGAIADVIAREQPHLIGLQEVSQFLVQSPGDFLAGNPVRAGDVALDFLVELQSALAERGQQYVVASSVENSDVEFISATGDDLRQIDREVILARSDVTVTASQTGRFVERVSIPLPGGSSLDIPRGWVMADVVVEGVPFRFISTHLEIGAFHDVQINQAEELVRDIPQTSSPTILVGDINSRPIRSTPTTYSTIVDAGYVDTWMALTSEPGATCCHDDDLMNEQPALAARIDMIFHRGGFEPVSSTVVGDDVDEKTAAGLWPSDHAGVVATLTLP